MPNTRAENLLLRSYDLLWKTAIPFMRKQQRLAEGFAQRTLEQGRLCRAGLWIQAASAGEAYLAWEILKRLPGDDPSTILLTTNTRQGWDILTQAARDLQETSTPSKVQVAYFPFDRPAVMQQAVQRVRPRVVALLEGELWPGFLWQLKRIPCRVLLLNGRITPRSLARYMLWPEVWRRLQPDEIHAVSRADADRYALLFDNAAIGVMPNIKFDRLDAGAGISPDENRMAHFPTSSGPFLIMGSVRREEERSVARILLEILRRKPDAVIGLFPRHMHRIAHWRRALTRFSIPWHLRSHMPSRVPGGSVVLWDVFGELGPAYRHAVTAFVGGSLAPLGGQNFLEPLMNGVRPVIGPYWDNFKWVGEDILRLGMVRRAASWKEVADFLVEDIMKPPQKDEVRRQALNYIGDRQGGAAIACRVIAENLKPESPMTSTQATLKARTWTP